MIKHAYVGFDERFRYVYIYKKKRGIIYEGLKVCICVRA